MVLKDKVAVVTGASSGVGRAIAERFLEEGAYVAVCARRLGRLQDFFGKRSRALVERVDVTNAREIERFVGSVMGTLRRVDILVNNAGVSIPGSVAETELEDWRYTFAVNVEAAFYFCKVIVPLMISQNYGRIINVSSGASVNCAARHGAYNASKAALNALTRTLACELTDYDIKVNMMSPGPCRTEMAPDGPLEPEAALPTAMFLATLPSDGPSGSFFWLMKQMEVIPDLSHINWTNPDI